MVKYFILESDIYTRSKLKKQLQTESKAMKKPKDINAICDTRKARLEQKLQIKLRKTNFK